jgi:hypothetical protein
MLKTNVSLFALMSVMLSLTLPAWSMEENGEDGKSQGTGPILMSIPHEIRGLIFSFGTPEDVAALRLTCHDSHDVVSVPGFLKPLIKDAYLETWEEGDGDSVRKQATSVYFVIKRAGKLAYQGQKQEAEKLYVKALLSEDSALSTSRLVALNLAILLTKDNSLLSSEEEDTKRFVKGRIKTAMESLFLEANQSLSQDSFKSRKEETFLELYLSSKKSFEFTQATIQSVQKRIDEADEAISGNNWREKRIPGYLFRLMAKSPRLQLNSDVKLQYLKAAADLGDRETAYNLGQHYSWGIDLPQAVQWYRQAADQGHPEALYELGACYEHGRGVKKDPKQAINWYHQAGEQGHMTAQWTLANCYFYSKIVKKDLAQAVHWYGQAGEQGHAEAQYMIGFCYENGMGVEEDLTQASYWYKKAAEKDHEKARFALDKLRSEGFKID